VKFVQFVAREELRDEAEFLCLGRGFAPIVHAELAVDVFEVGLDGVDGDVQRLRYLLVGLAIGEQIQDFQFALTQRLYEICDLRFAIFDLRFPHRPHSIGNRK